VCVRLFSVNIIDNMLETMEKYGQTLEVMIDERTTALLKQKEKTDKLLYSLMPKYVLIITWQNLRGSLITESVSPIFKC